jgi:hypothetical protein
MKMKMDGDRPLLECSLCSRWFQFGEHIYKGRIIAVWEAQICDGCLAGNHDGIMPETHPQFIERLRTKGIPITLNHKGWLDIPPQ